MHKECDAAETYAMTAATLNRLLCNDRAMVRWISNVKARDKVSSDSLLLKHGIQNLDVVRHTSRLRWLGCVEVCKLNVVPSKRLGRPKKPWMNCWRMTERSFEWILLTLRIVLSGEDVLEKDL